MVGWWMAETQACAWVRAGLGFQTRQVEPDAVQKRVSGQWRLEALGGLGIQPGARKGLGLGLGQNAWAHKAVQDFGEKHRDFEDFRAISMEEAAHPDPATHSCAITAPPPVDPGAR